MVRVVLKYVIINYKNKCSDGINCYLPFGKESWRLV